jgi:hypothetical protein
MCSLAENDWPSDDNLSVDSNDTEASAPSSTVCKKCRSCDAEVTLRRRDRYCRPCFTAAATHKFRATLGKNRVMRHAERVCVDFDGGRNSVALLKLINSSLDEKNAKVTKIIAQPKNTLINPLPKF